MPRPQDRKQKKAEKRSSPQSRRLYFLIKSMSTQERRSFNQYCGLMFPAQELQFNKLYNTISTLTEFDEEKMNRRVLRIAKNAHNAAQMKLDLYKRLLQFLRYHLDSKPRNTDTKIRTLLMNVRIVYDRGLPDQVLYFVKKIKKLIEDTERYFYLPEIMDWEKRALFLTSQKNIKATFDDFKEKEEEAYQKVQNLRNIWNIHFDLLAVHREQGFVTRQEQVNALQETLNQLDTIKNHTIFSPHDKILYHFSHQIFHHTIGDWQQSYYHNQQIIQLLNQNSKIANEYKHYYINSIHEISRCYLFQKKYDLGTQTIELINTPRFNTHYKFFRIYHTYKIVLNIETGSFEKNLDIVTKLEGNIEEMAIHFKLPLYFLATYNYFGVENYDQVSHYSNIIFDNAKLSSRLDLVSTTKIMDLIMNLELDNIKLLEFKLRSTYNFLRTRERLHSFEQIVIRFIRRVIDIQESSASFNKKKAKALFIDALQLFKHDIESLRKKEPYNHFFNYFNYTAWIDSKLENKSFKEIAQTNSNHHKRPSIPNNK